jgi:GT2 family glycosyltransferase
MHNRESGVSIIIPVRNRWDLTEQCLRSLRQTLSDGTCEIIVVDNASADATPTECPTLGSGLFGRDFLYRRADRNLNFGPASNLGARLASRPFLCFLNNDTIALPGWLEPLVQDFAEYPDLAASGPVLLYPAGDNPLGDTVQHLGVFVNTLLKLGHLYEGIPAASPLTRKRRFFQVVTAACMCIPRALFEEAGGFTEGYINGFEDVDLCARLWRDGRAHDRQPGRAPVSPDQPHSGTA